MYKFFGNKIIFLSFLILVLGFIFGFTNKAEAATNVYYSVGQNVTDHKTGTPTLDIVSGVGTFDVAQTATNMGVGDKVTFNTSSVCYISGKQSTSVWNLVTATGVTCGDVTDATVDSITHAFASLYNAVGLGAVGNATSTNYMNTANLVTGNFILNIPVYYDSGPDTTALTISGYTTDATRYIRIYTATSTTSEVNQSQRHSGVWNSSKFRLEVGNSSIITLTNVAYVFLDGLQIKKTSSNADSQANYYVGGTIGATNALWLSNSILVQAGNNTYKEPYVLLPDTDSNVYIWNTIMYGNGTYNGNGNAGIKTTSPIYVYNSTVISGRFGMYGPGAITVKNSYASGGAAAAYTSATLTTSASSDATGSAGLQSIAINTTNFTNVSAGTEDYRLPANTSALYNTGTNTSADSAPLNFTTDIKNITRPSGGGWDIGADEYEVIADSQAPVVTAFTIPSTATSRTISVSSFTATDNTSVTGYKITESSTPPGYADAGWTGSVPSTYIITGVGTSHTLYAYAKDAAGNVSVGVASQPISISIMTASCNSSDIQAEMNNAVNGDTINIPAGTCTWTTVTTGVASVTTNKEIVLQGAGIDSTVIIDGTDSTGSSEPLSMTGNNWRVTGFTFSGMQRRSTTEPAITAYGTGWRIDHNKFDGTTYAPNQGRGIIANGTGVIDNNTFRNTYQGATVYGSGDTLADWLNPLTLGTSNAVYIENNTFDYDHAYDGASDAYSSARVVFRYNTVINTVLGFHGFGTGSHRGTFSYEVYNNTFTKSVDSNSVGLGLSSGTGVVFNNTFTGNYNGMTVTNYRAYTDYTGLFTPEGVEIGTCDGNNILDGNTSPIEINHGWPCRDQIGRTANQASYPLHEWNNTLNSVAAHFGVNSNCTGNCSTAILVEGRDYINNTVDSLYSSYTYPHPLTSTYTIGGTTSGLSGTVVLQNNSGDNLTLSANGSFTFATPLNNSATYAVTLLTQPSGQTCTVGSGSGTVSSANVTSVTVTCVNTTKAITAFDFNGLSPAVVGSVNETDKTIALTVPYGTSVTALIPTITQTGSSVSPASGVAQDFTTPATYTVTAANASTQAYIVTVSVGTAPVVTPTGGGNGPIYGSTRHNISNLIATTTPLCTTSTTPIILTRNLSRGSEGNDVTTLQNFLVSKNFLTSNSITGYFGITTETAVKAFQKSSGLVSSGTPQTTGYGNVGPVTRAKINSLGSTTTCTPTQTNTVIPASTSYNFARNLSLNMTGEDVRQLQQFLNTNGFTISTTGAGSPGKETALFGTLTYKALVKFQKSIGWSGTGFFGPITRAYVNKK